MRRVEENVSFPVRFPCLCSYFPVLLASRGNITVVSITLWQFEIIQPYKQLVKSFSCNFAKLQKFVELLPKPPRCASQLASAAAVESGNGSLLPREVAAGAAGQKAAGD